MTNKNPSRRRFLRCASLGALGLSLHALHRAEAASPPASRLVFIGTYTKAHSEGIYVYRLDLTSGQLRRVATTTNVVNPSFLTIDRHGRYLYAVNEVSEFQNQPTGAVSAFAIDQRSGALQFLNQQPSAGAGPCHLTLAANSNFLLVANYDAGSLTALPVRQGKLLAPLETIQHHGSSVNAARQQGPHAHGVSLDKANRFLFVPDLGIDQVVSYHFDSRTGKLIANDAGLTKLKPGAGPRHFKFHPANKWGYVINELDSTVTAFSYDKAHGVLREFQTISTLPADFSGTSFCAELEVASSGRFLYGSNRGHDSIVVFSIDQSSGRLALVQHVSTQGKTPRNFAIDPTGGFLLAANQNSDNVVTFRIDRVSGKLTPTGHSTEVPTPVCITMSDKL